MSLSEAAQRIEARTQVDKTCVFGRILRDLSDEDRAFYDAMVAAGKTWVYITAVFNDELEKQGKKLTNEVAVRRHALGKCPCH